ncbi:DUF58 domain-containing protein [Salinicoccus siamensis]|uniref:DUF58 domain-containing protein n=1 Tax=Salinicoccus siamensis TaxID=381830 RepID=A0ABV5Z2F5_9STAP
MKFKADFKDSRAMSFFIGAPIILFLLNVFYTINLNVMLIASLGLFLSFALLNHLYGTHMPKKLQIEIMDKEMRMYKSQSGKMRIKIVQNGRLPILDGRLTITARDNIRFDDEHNNGTRHHTMTSVRFTVMPRSSVIIEIPFTGQARGVSKIIGARMEIPQLFGFSTFELKQIGTVNHEIIVYPDRYAIHNDRMATPPLQGSFQQKNALFNDPLLTTGTREYLPQDSMRDIHWKASARTGGLQTKRYEKTTKVTWMILINLQSDLSYMPPENIETIFEKIAFTTNQAAENNIPYKIISNMVTFDNRSFFRLEEGSGALHYKRTLEALARINAVTYTVPFERFLKHVRLHEDLPAHVIFTGQADPAIEAELSQFRAKGAHIFQLDTYGVTPFEAHSMRGVSV